MLSLDLRLSGFESQVAHQIQRVSSVAEREAHNLDVTRAIRVPATILASAMDAGDATNVAVVGSNPIEAANSRQ